MYTKMEKNKCKKSGWDKVPKTHSWSRIEFELIIIIEGYTLSQITYDD